MNKAEVLSNHLEFKRTSINSKNKLKDIERYVGRFINSSEKPLNKFTEADLTKFINSTTEKHSVWATNDIKTFTKVFIKWYYEDYASRFRNLDRICRTQKAPKSHEPEQMLTPKEVDKLIDGEHDPVWKLYWAIFYYGGFRPSEACGLEWKSVNFDKKGTTIKVFSRKNNKTFYKSLPDKVAKDLEMYREHNKDQRLIFPSPLKHDQPIKAKTVYFRLIKLSQKVMGKSVYPYTLRHSFATTHYNSDDENDGDVANQLGHSSSMKPTYVNLDEEKLKKRARKMWSGPVTLTSKKKHELQIKIEEQSKEIKELKRRMDLAAKEMAKSLEFIRAERLKNKNLN